MNPSGPVPTRPDRAPGVPGRFGAHANNGEENTYPDYLGSFTKGLPHNEFGEVEPRAFRRFVRALTSGEQATMERVPLDSATSRPLVNPLAGVSVPPTGPDHRLMTMAPAPRMDSPQVSAEACELYWMALCRDVPFLRFEDDPLVHAAVADLNRLSDYRVPRRNGRVDPDLLFRGDTPGDVRGPYVSQFLLRDVQNGTYRIPQRQDTVEPGRDYVTTFPTWLRVQRGWDRALAASDRDHDDPRYVYTPRGLAHWVHFDAGPTPATAFVNAALILYDEGFPLDDGHPYVDSDTQEGFATYGTPHLLELLHEAAVRALRAVWYQKWYVHRRLRPEAFGARVHNRLTGARAYEFLDGELLDSDAVHRAYSRWGSYLVPQAYPEGSPMHPSYGAGHATAAAACATVLKAWHDEATVVADPVQANADGTALVPYRGADADRLTVGGELDKLAANIAIGRNMAGVHWRTDYTESVLLGETVAVELLREHAWSFPEYGALSVTRLDGTAVRV